MAPLQNVNKDTAVTFNGCHVLCVIAPSRLRLCVGPQHDGGRCFAAHGGTKYAGTSTNIVLFVCLFV